MNEAEFESWLNAVENVCGDYTQAEAKAVLVKKFGELQAQLAECYRLTGADPDGNEDWRLAPHAVGEVKRLREESNQLAEQLAGAKIREVEAIERSTHWAYQATEEAGCNKPLRTSIALLRQAMSATEMGSGCVCDSCSTLRIAFNATADESLTVDLLVAELTEAKQQNREWIKQNAPGGWIDDLRVSVKTLETDFNRRTDILNNHIAREKVLEEENSRLLLASRYNSDIADQALSAMKDANARMKALEEALYSEAEKEVFEGLAAQFELSLDKLWPNGRTYLNSDTHTARVFWNSALDFAKQALAAKEPSGDCPACNGNDADMPCAYPSEGKHGCLRDKRLAAKEPIRCADCDECARHAYSDATTPGFFSPKCKTHSAKEPKACA
jgi:hypothetical protein